MKVSRADWLTELRNPDKAEAWVRYCHYFWLVAGSKDIIKDDLPEDWGLLVPHGRSLRVVKLPQRRFPEVMPQSVLVSLARGVQKTEAAVAIARAKTS